jgi:hypothetical protein
MVRAVPGQTDEFYYQHARRLVIAEMQHIIYNEYLPVMIGRYTYSSVFFNFEPILLIETLLNSKSFLV